MKNIYNNDVDKSLEILPYVQQHLQNFLREHPAINISEIETICDLPNDTLRHFLKNRRSIPLKYFNIVVSELSKYGYVCLESE